MIMNIVIKSKTIERVFLKKRLFKESAMVAADSMVVLQEFERFEEDLPCDELDEERITHLSVGPS
jgi:hypothetical protein